jgi:hypothetical protein
VATDYVIATDVLTVPGRGRAHNPGDQVPRVNVEPNGWGDFVAEPDSDDADAALTAVADAPGSYDPGVHKVDEVLDYLGTVDAAEQQRVLTAERAGQNRKGIVGES